MDLVPLALTPVFVSGYGQHRRQSEGLLRESVPDDERPDGEGAAERVREHGRGRAVPREESSHLQLRRHARDPRAAGRRRTQTRPCRALKVSVDDPTMGQEPRLP